jgi:molybdenum cofactor biosynthesis enzyme MoaA
LQHAISLFRQLRLVSPLDSARLAARFPLTAMHMLRDGAAGIRATAFPRRLGLFLTNRCDSACAMCAVRDARDERLALAGDLPFELVDTVLAECSPHQPVVDLIGGEPLLYSHLHEAVKLASQRNVLAVVTTNALKLKDNAEALVQANLPILQVSLDGWDGPSQQARGHVKGSFERLCDGVRAVQEAKGKQAFPIIRVLTAITRVNHAHLDRIHSVIAELGIRSWGIANYFYLNRHAHERHQAFALMNGLTGSVVAQRIPDDVYLTPEQVRDLKSSLQRVRRLNRRLRTRIAYAWDIDVDAYYSTAEASRSLLCELPYARLDIHTDGHMAVCVSGKRVGQVGRDSIAGIWCGRGMARYRALYERTRPMPMCFRCCGLSQTIRFDGLRAGESLTPPARPPAPTAPPANSETPTRPGR